SRDRAVAVTGSACRPDTTVVITIAVRESQALRLTDFESRSASPKIDTGSCPAGATSNEIQQGSDRLTGVVDQAAKSASVGVPTPIDTVTRPSAGTTPCRPPTGGARRTQSLIIGRSRRTTGG